MHIRGTVSRKTFTGIMAFERLALETMKLIEESIQRQNNAGAWLGDYLQYAKNSLNQTSFLQADASCETPKRSSKTSLPKPVRRLSDEDKVVLSPRPKRSSSIKIVNEVRMQSIAKSTVCDNVDIQSMDDDNMLEHVPAVDEPLRNSNDECHQQQDENKYTSNRTFYVTPKLMKVLQDVKNTSARSSTKTPNKDHPLPKRVVATKSSKHRNSLNRSLILSAKKPAAKSRALRQTREKQDHEEAVAKKQALLKMKVEEHKKKREMKMERNLRARQQIEQQQTEQRLKKMSMQQKEERTVAAATKKDAEKRKNGAKNKKRKQTDSSDSDKPTVTPAVKVIKANSNKLIPVVSKSDSADSKKSPIEDVRKPVAYDDDAKASNGSNTKKPEIVEAQKLNSGGGLRVETVTPSGSEEKQKPLNTTYVAEKENVESYAMTPCVQETSRTNYEMSDLRPSDDEDDDIDTTKPIPSWATGIRLKEALIKQYFQPPDLNELFPAIEISEDENFGMSRRRANRTSSAVWLSTPVRDY